MCARAFSRDGPSAEKTHAVQPGLTSFRSSRQPLARRIRSEQGCGQAVAPCRCLCAGLTADCQLPILTSPTKPCEQHSHALTYWQPLMPEADFAKRLT